MTVSVSAADYAALTKRLREVDKKVARAARKRLREAAGPIGKFVIVAAAEHFPHRGGFSKRVLAVKQAISSNSSGAGLRLTHKGIDLRSLERGKLRHPKWPGKRSRDEWRWDEQDVPAEVFANALQHLPPEHRRRFEAVVAEIIKEVK